MISELTFIENQTKIVMSITEYSSKIYKPSLYKKVTSNPVHNQKWQKAIEKKLQNLKNHQIWKYNEYFLGQKAIRSTWIFKIKYHFNRLVARFKARLVIHNSLQV